MLDDVTSLFETRGAGMDAKLHNHAVKEARKAVKQGKGPMRAYGEAAGAWCPQCEAPEPMDNGMDATSVSLTYCCDACGHQWSPHEA